MAIEPRVTPVERLLFRSDLVAAGAFRCPSHHPLFKDSGPISGYLIVFPRTSTTIVFDNGRRITASAPVAMFYNEGQVYTRKRIDAVDACEWFMVAPEVVREIVMRYDHPAADAGRIFRFSSGYASPGVYLAQRRLAIALAAGEASDRLHVEESVLGLFDAAVGAAYGTRPVDDRHRAHDGVEVVKSIIASRPAANPPLHSLAAEAGCSPFQLCRTFRARTGYTITSFRHALRARLALSHLRRRDSDISDIALTLGYSSHSHFTMQFRRHFGITPAQFRAGVVPLTA